MKLLGNATAGSNGQAAIDQAEWPEFDVAAARTLKNSTGSLGEGARVDFASMGQQADAGALADSLGEEEGAEEDFGGFEEDPTAGAGAHEQAHAELGDIHAEIEAAKSELDAMMDEIETLKMRREELSESLHEETEILLQQAKEDAGTHRDMLVSQAQDEASRHKQEVIEEMARVKKEAFAEAYAKGQEEGHADGFKAGFEAGKKNAAQDLTSLFNALRSAIEKSNSLLSEVAQNSESQIISLAMNIARKVIQREIMLDPKATADLIRAALQKVSHRKEFFIKVSPVDHESLKAQEPYLRQDLKQIVHFEVLSDSRVEPGGCLIETEAGSVEASIQKQLQFIEEQLQGLAPGPAGG